MPSLKSIKESFDFYTKPSGYYIGWLGHGNLGDEAIFWAFKELFKRVQFRDYPYIGKILKKFPGLVDYIFLGGGTLIGNYPMYLDTARMLIDAFPKAKRIAFGTGVRNPVFWKNNMKSSLKEWVELLNEFDFVSVRGPLSSGILQDYGLDASKIHIIGDPALFFYPR